MPIVHQTRGIGLARISSVKGGMGLTILAPFATEVSTGEALQRANRHSSVFPLILIVHLHYYDGHGKVTRGLAEVDDRAFKWDIIVPRDCPRKPGTSQQPQYAAAFLCISSSIDARQGGTC